MARATAIAKGRVETLTDGVFAIAMTLLVLSIDVPAVPEGQDAAAVLPGLVLGLAPQVIACAIAFWCWAGSGSATSTSSASWPGSTTASSC